MAIPPAVNVPRLKSTVSPAWTRRAEAPVKLADCRLPPGPYKPKTAELRAELSWVLAVNVRVFNATSAKRAWAEATPAFSVAAQEVGVQLSSPASTSPVELMPKARHFRVALSWTRKPVP